MYTFTNWQKTDNLLLFFFQGQLFVLCWLAAGRKEESKFARDNFICATLSTKKNYFLLKIRIKIFFFIFFNVLCIMQRCRASEFFSSCH